MNEIDKLKKNAGLTEADKKQRFEMELEQKIREHYDQWIAAGNPEHKVKLYITEVVNRSLNSAIHGI